MRNPTQYLPPNFFFHQTFFYGLAVENIRYVFFNFNMISAIFKTFFLYSTRKKCAAVKGKFILVTAKHLAGNEQVNVRRSLNKDIKICTKHKMCAFSSTFE